MVMTTKSPAYQRRDIMLKQMGITQFELRRPMALKGEVAIALPNTIRLVIIAAQPDELDSPLFLDILQSMALNASQIYCITPEQAMMLPKNDYPLWLIGEDLLADEDINSTLVLNSPDLTELAHNAVAKRALWQAICQHEDYFFTHAS